MSEAKDHSRATPQAAPAPAPTEHEREMAASLLKAMARNYAAGHAWDHLDGKACTNAARLLRTQAPAVPAGWQLVPVEPTEAMDVAGALAHEQSNCHDHIGPINSAWSAMLAAAPQPPTAPQGAQGGGK